MRRVVITGIGLLTPLGTGREESWRAMLEGRSAVGRLERIDPGALRTQIGAEISSVDPADFVKNRRLLRMMTRNDQLAVAGATLAVQDSGIDPTKNGERTGLYVGSNKEASHPEPVMDVALAARRDDASVDLHRLGGLAVQVPPLFYVEGLQAASLFYISEMFGLKGANAYFGGTGDVGATAIGTAYRAVRRGEVDLAVAGGFDDPVSWWPLSRLTVLDFLTDRNDLGARAYQPYDRDRSGSVLGEGAAFVLLEEYKSAVARGARIHAEVTGFGSGFDGRAPYDPDPEGGGLVRALHAALAESAISSQDVDYVVSDGAGTIVGDIAESRALRAVFGASHRAPVASSVKPATGNLLGAAGALNVAIAALAVAGGVVPPTLNLENPDPECEMNWVRGTSRKLPVHRAAAVARGLENQNVVLALRAPED